MEIPSGWYRDRQMWLGVKIVKILKYSKCGSNDCKWVILRKTAYFSNEILKERNRYFLFSFQGNVFYIRGVIKK